MHASDIQHVSVWLDDASLDDGTFSHALDWAVGLNLPIRGVATTSDSDRTARVPVHDRMRVWGTACAQKGIALQTHLLVAGTQCAVDHFLRPGGLCVFRDPAGSFAQRDLLNRSMQMPAICQLICPRTYLAIRRVLILCHQTNISSAYLETAARICQELDTTPLILVLANSEREAQAKQGYVEGICNCLRLQADLDTVVHHDLVQAVVRVLSWRRCSHVIVERQADVSLRVVHHLVEKCLGPIRPASILLLPAAAALNVPRKMRCTRQIFRWSQLPEVEHVSADTKNPV